MTRERAAALIVFPSPMLFAEYSRIAGLAADNRLPAIYAAREGVDVGGLMSYGNKFARSFPADSGLCRQNSQGRKTGGVARAATNQIRVDHQYEDGKNTGADDCSRFSPARRRGD